MKTLIITACLLLLISGCYVPDSDIEAHTNQADDETGVRKMVELRVIDDEMRVKLGLNNADDMLVTLPNDANKTQHTILYVSKDLDEEFMAAPDKFIHKQETREVHLYPRRE